jgi:murein DD-endopeptidase MepM/ murein hydrolase activator NlpD
MDLMSRPRTLILAAVLAALVIGLVPPVAGALTPGQAQSELSRTREQLELMRARITEAQARKTALDAEVQGIDAQLGVIESQLAETGAQITSVERKLKKMRARLDRLRADLRETRIELKIAEDRLAAQQAAFEQRVVALYKTNDLSYLDVLLRSTDFADLVGRYRVVHDLVGGETDLLGQLDAARAAVEAERAALDEKQQEAARAAVELEEQRSALAALRAAQQEQRDAAYAARQDKAGTLAAANADLAELESQEDELLAQSQSLTSIINGSAGGGNGTGSMIWPVNGTVTSGFGYRIHPILGKRLLHTGIDIAAGSGTAIWAADSGKVIYATWSGGYGNTVAIDHGGGISTLYAHQSSMAVSYGQTVSKGEVIGYVGSTGYSTGPHLHFEVRVNGTPVDPMGYLP